MAKIIENLNKNKLNNTENLGNQTLNNQASNSLGENQTLNNAPEAKKGLFTIPEAVLPFVSFLPLALESMTGQKIPAMGGTIGDIQSNISNLTLTLQQVLNNQQQIFSKINSLESNANQQLISLDKRLENIQSLRLTHERERKQIEYNNPRKSLEQEEEY